MLGYADGLAVSPLAYQNKTPVILTRSTELPSPAASAVLCLGITDVTILDPTAALSQNGEGYLPSAYAGTKPYIQVYGGSNVVSDTVMNKLRDLLL